MLIFIALEIVLLFESGKRQNTFICTIIEIFKHRVYVLEGH